MFKQRLGLQIRGFRQQRLGLWPNLHQRIFTCSPTVLGLQFLRRLRRRHILPGRRPAHGRLQRAVRYVSSSLIFTHQFSVLLFGDHSQRPPPRPSGRGKNHCAIIPNHRQTNNRHWKILIVASHPLQNYAEDRGRVAGDQDHLTLRRAHNSDARGD